MATMLFESRRLVWLSLLVVGCDPQSCRRPDPQDASRLETGTFGQTTGNTDTTQCSGWFPDWTSPHPPASGVASFQLAQGYPLGSPVLEAAPDGGIRIARWDPPPAATDTTSAPWLAHDFHLAAERLAYLNDLKEFVLLGMPEVDFVAQRNTHRSWFHVPMMTTSPTARREPYRGVTKERGLRRADHKWILDTASFGLNSYAIGYYNYLGGYTIGQVFNNLDPALSTPQQARFIPGALVFKLIFAEYDTTKIDATSDPLVDAPEWQVQDVGDPNGPLRHVRLLQVDVAVRDSRSAATGWVFATFVYDRTLTSETNPWRRLTPVGLQWGNDDDVTAANVGTIDESWLNPSVPAALLRQDGQTFGRNGRLNGPVDNPVSSCLSCHGTSQVVLGAATQDAFRGVALFPPDACTDAQDMKWFRVIGAATPFGVMSSGGTGCELVSPQPSTPPLVSLDYSLQLADALESSLFFHNPNPCAALATSLVGSVGVRVGDGDQRAGAGANQLRPEAFPEAPLLLRQLRTASRGVEMTRRSFAVGRRQSVQAVNAPSVQTPSELHRR